MVDDPASHPEQFRTAEAEGQERNDPMNAELFNPEQVPSFHYPFAGGGSLPLEAQRLGLESHVSDLNPVAVLIEKATIEIPQRFAGDTPVNPEAIGSTAPSLLAGLRGMRALPEDISHYGRRIRDEACGRIGHLYRPVEVTTALGQCNSELRPRLYDTAPCIHCALHVAYT
jgi:putative DNA methylase